jgi:hypothetical protein
MQPMLSVKYRHVIIASSVMDIRILRRRNIFCFFFNLFAEDPSITDRLFSTAFLHILLYFQITIVRGMNWNKSLLSFNKGTASKEVFLFHFPVNRQVAALPLGSRLLPKRELLCFTTAEKILSLVSK